MPDSGGVFSRVYNWVTDRDASVPITASRMDTEMDGFATALNNRVTRDGSSTVTANLPMGGFIHTGVGAASARTHYARADQVQDDSLKYASTSGTDTYTATLSPAIAAYANGLSVYIKFVAANTGAATLNLNSIGAVAIRKFHDVALASGDIEANSILHLVYNSTIPCFEIIGPIASLSAAGMIDKANTWTQQQTSSAATPWWFSYSDDGAAPGPLLMQERISASAAADDLLADQLWRGRNASGTTRDYIEWAGIIRNATAGAEDSGLILVSYYAGAAAVRWFFGADITMQGLTRQGAGTINCAGLFVNNVQLTSKVVQRVYAETGAVATGSTVMPGDDTIPQNTEGDQYLSVSITPTSATNRLRIRVIVWGSQTTANHLVSGLFQDSVANALAGCLRYNAANSRIHAPMEYSWEMVAGTTSATTFKVRVGPSAAATVTINGESGARLLGGVFFSTIIIEEIVP